MIRYNVSRRVHLDDPFSIDRDPGADPAQPITAVRPCSSRIICDMALSYVDIAKMGIYVTQVTPTACGFRPLGLERI
jgi:hypothetical protein